jgi:hypothetical protein
MADCGISFLRLFKKEEFDLIGAFGVVLEDFE